MRSRAGRFARHWGLLPAAIQLGAKCAAIGLAMSAPAFGADSASAVAKAEVCVACHGPGGSSVIPANPSLAGQPKQFLTTQLVMFREGNRKDPQMTPFAAKLTNADINELGTYFSAQPLAAPSAPAPAAATIADGARLVARFNCNQCHGPELKGLQHIPRLIGQQREYLRAQLRGFKAGTRFDMDGNMTSAAQPLTEADIDVLAEFLAGSR